MVRYAIPLVVFALLIGLFWVGLGLNPRELPSPLVGREAPVFAVPDLLEPQRTVSNESFRGEVTVFNVFASWCVSCRREHHLLVEMQSQGVRIIGLNYKDERPDALAYLRQGGNPYEMIGFDLRGDVGIEWGVYGTPETFVVDRNGVIRHKHTGPLHRQILQQEILPLIAQLERE